LIALDDVDAVAGVAATELAMFALHNRQRDADAALVYASRTPLESLPIQLPDLRSRLGQMLRLALPVLDDAQRRAVVMLRANAAGLAIDQAALDYLLHRVGRDLHGLVAWIDRIDRASLAAKRRITLPFLRELLVGDQHLA
jgi:DnaA family protein